MAKHPLGHLANGRGGLLELTLQIPMNAGNVSTEIVGQTRHHLEREIESLLAHRAAFQPGRSGVSAVRRRIVSIQPQRVRVRYSPVMAPPASRSSRISANGCSNAIIRRSIDSIGDHHS